MGKKIFIMVLAVGLAVLLLPNSGKAVCDPDQIKMDGDFSDWADCETLVTDNSGESTHMQYWDRNTSSWTTTDPGYATWTFDDAAMMDVSKFKLLNDENYIYFYMKNGWPMMAMQAPDGVFFGMWTIGNPDDQARYMMTYGFMPTSVPEFDHWMVWSFDKNLDGIYDYHFGAHLNMGNMTQGEDGGPGLAIYKDDGDSSFDADKDEKLADVDTKDSSTSMDSGLNADSLEFEIKQRFTTVYKETGINYGDTVKVRMQTRSEVGDTTKGKKYTFDLGAPNNLRAKDLTTTSANLKWKKHKLAKSYIVNVYTKKGKLVENFSTTSTNQEVSGLEAGKAYKFKVRAVNKKDFKGSWSFFKKFKTKSY